ncbi:GTPase [Candidatus Micrarchaeota archaeon]|nr:GTPase [Candidatus Micrarchaeota archaeon]
MKKKIVIIGAAGRDFHNFNVLFKDNNEYEVICFTATQIPGIDGRKYPKILSGKMYPKGIPIYPEQDLEKLIKKYKIDECILSYSDLSYNYVMNLASRVNSAGADFKMLSAESTMLKSKKPVIAVCAVRTGCGKSQTTRYIANYLKQKGKRVIIIRHPMPYGDLSKQVVQRFETLQDLEKYNTTIEEREEYEEHIKNGFIVYAGVDYQRILKQAELEADVIIWDGGNNDTPFYKPDLMFTVADALRPGHEKLFYPGEITFRIADAIIINKENTANNRDIDTIVLNAKNMNSKAKIIHADSIITLEGNIIIKNKKILIIEDGPTLTHGGMSFGAGYKAVIPENPKIINCKKYISGSIKQTFEKYSHLDGRVLPAMGYSKEQIKELEKIILNIHKKEKLDYIVSGTPIDLKLLIKTKVPILKAKYELKEKSNIIQILLLKIN